MASLASHGSGKHYGSLHVYLAAIVIGAATLWMAVRSKGGMTLLEFLSLMALMWAALIYGHVMGGKAAALPMAAIWGFAIAFRVIGLFADPVFEDDWYRYLWDGRTFVVEGNPYEHAPLDYFTTDAPEQFQRILDEVNHPDVPTIYGPVCQYMFAVAYLVAPGELWPLKTILLTADLVVIWCLLQMTTVRNTLLYAWCPLVLHETAINAHPEILGVAPAVAGMYLLHRGRACLSLAAFAVACAARVHGVLLLPFVLLRAERKYWAIVPVTFAFLYLPFWLQGTLADWAGLRSFFGNWEFNSTVYALLASTLGVQGAKVISALTFAMAGGLLLKHERIHNAMPRGDYIYGLLFLLSAVVNPWYLLWILPFVAVFPSVTGLTACAVVSLSYVHGLNLVSAGLDPYEHPWWVRPIEITAVAVAFVVDLLRRSAPERKAG